MINESILCFVVCFSGQVYSLGRADYGRLGLGEGAEEKTEPTPVMGMEPACGVTCGTSVSYAVTRDGEEQSPFVSCQYTEGNEGVRERAKTNVSVPLVGSVYAWGMGTNLQLGTGGEEDEWSPVKMTGKQLENRTVLMASSGGQHTVLLVKDNQES